MNNHKTPEIKLEDFCRERCEIYKQTVIRSEGYNLPELVQQQREKINPYCRETCSHTAYDFMEWIRAKELPPQVKRLFGIV
jgi:hypothetical protein